jgi:hypothetical protein
MGTFYVAGSHCRYFDEILIRPDTIDARRAIEQLTGKYHINELDLRLRAEMFRVCEWCRSGRQLSDGFTIDRRQTLRLAQRLHEDARTLKKAPTVLLKLAIQQGATPASTISGLFTPDWICELIEAVAVGIKKSLKETDGRSPDWTLEPKRELTQFVWRQTRKPLDRLVADLIGAILRIPGYTAEDQQKFRFRHCRLEGTDTLLPPGLDTIPPKKD